MSDQYVRRCASCGAWKWAGRICTPCDLLEHERLLATWREKQ